MMKTGPNSSIIEDYEKYESTVTGLKNTPVSPIIVKDKKQNHRGSLYKKQPVIHESLTDNISVIIEIREFCNRFSICLDSDRFPDCILFRYDSAGTTHRNNFPDIPLNEQSVTTPHFHKFNERGYYVAYKTQKLQSEAEARALCDIQFGFPYFCQESNIRHGGELPELEIISGEMFFESSDDPLESITFA
jgi:hypothetical protein